MLIQEKTTLQQRVAASPADVYFALTNNYSLHDWFCAEALLDERVGGRFYAGWNDGYSVFGHFTEVVPEKVLAYTWRGNDESAPGHVRVELDGQEGATTVTVTYEPAEGADPAAVAAVEKRWRAGLENLEAAFDNGIDLRLARRPMLGITGLREVGPDFAKQLGVPVDAGVHIAGTVEGLAAAEAGIQKDDVLVGVDGRDITTGSALVEALGAHQAGDEVEVVYYRGAEKITRMMKLSARPPLEVPTDTAHLASHAREFYDKQNGGVAELFANCSEEEASWRPAEGEWNAKEVVGHLIAVEHDSQVWIAMMSEGTDYTVPFHTNLHPRIKAIAAQHANKEGVLEELRRASAVSVAILENLPEHVVRRKYLFNQLSLWWFNATGHGDEHVAEIARLLELARAAK